MAKQMTDEERYGKVGAEIRRLDPEAYKNRPKTLEGNLKLLQELRNRKPAEESESISISKGPSARRGPRSVSDQASRASAAMERNRSYLPSDRATGFRTQAEETGLNEEERAQKARDYAGNIALAASGAAGAGRLAAGRNLAGRAGQVNVRGMTMAEREREAAAAAESARKIKRLREAGGMRGTQGGRGYAKGGAIKSSASKRADGCAVKGKTRGKMI